MISSPRNTLSIWSWW